MYKTAQVIVNKVKNQLTPFVHPSKVIIFTCITVLTMMRPHEILILPTQISITFMLKNCSFRQGTDNRIECDFILGSIDSFKM